MPTFFKPILTVHFVLLIMMSCRSQTHPHPARYDPEMGTFIFTNPDSAKIAMIAANTLLNEMPFIVQVLNTVPTLDTTRIIYYCFEDNRNISDSTEKIYQQTLRYIDKLANAKWPPNVVPYVLFSIYERTRGMMGRCIQFHYNLQNKELVNSGYLFEGGMLSNKPFLEKKLDKFQLASNQYLDLSEDSIIKVVTLVPELDKAPSGFWGLKDRSESLRVLYELVGKDVHEFTAIVEVFVDPFHNEFPMPPLILEDFGIHTNPLALIDRYKSAFPNRAKFCELCQ